MRFNLCDTPQYFSLDGKDHLLESVFFSGLYDEFNFGHLKMNGKVHVMGICFYPETFYPFTGIPVSEFRNQVLGVSEVGLRKTKDIVEQLKEAPDISSRLNILENKLIYHIKGNAQIPADFQQLFRALSAGDQLYRLGDFCDYHHINIRMLERQFNKYVGLSAKTYLTINRFQNSLNQLLSQDYEKLSDIAFDNGYFDQVHFIKHFKRFAGTTPRRFISQNNSMLQVGKFA